MKKILVATLLSTTMLFAAQGDHQVEITATAGGVMPEGNLDLEDSLSLGLRFGTYVEDKFFDILEVGFERAIDQEYQNSTEETDVNRFFVNLVKEYDLSKETALYSLIGIGYEDYRNGLFDNSDDGFVNYGVGIKQWLSDSFALKAEVRHAINFDGNNNLLYNLGFVIPIGKKVEQTEYKPQPVAPKPALVVKAEPKPKAAPKKKITPKDDDKDGVYNSIDQCPETPAGKVVDAKGCMKLVRLHVKFAFDKADVQSSYMPKIEEVVAFLQDNKDFKVLLEGHTDSRGSHNYNLKLSQKRADAVAAILKSKGIDVDRIVTRAFGETLPVASNDTDEGRAENRRVDATFDK